MLISFIVYSNSLNNTLVLDDGKVLTSNVFITSFKYLPFYLRGKITSISPLQTMFRPLWMISYNINFMVTKYDFWSYRLFNIIIHGLNGFFVYILLSLLFPSSSRGLRILLGIMFVVHPVNTEAVNYLSARSDLLVTLFIIMAVVSFLKWENKKDKKFLVLSYLSTFFAYLTKEFAIGIVLFLFFYLCLKKEIRHQFKMYLPYLLITIGIIFYWGVLYYGEFNSYLCSSYIHSIGTQLKVAGLYLKLFFFPSSLSLIHKIDDRKVIALLIVAVVTFIILYLKYRDWRFATGGIFFISFLFPKSLVKLDFPAMEHHFYLPEIGIWILLFAILEKVSFRRIFPVLLFITVVFSGVTFHRNKIWKSEESLWLNAWHNNPDSGYALTALGLAYLKEGEYDSAKEYLTLALEKCRQVKRLNLIIKALAEIYRRQQNLEKAEYILRSLYRMSPQDFDLLHALGVVYAQEGKYKQAEDCYRQVLKINPYYSRSIFNLGLLYFRHKEFDKARNWFQKYVELQPGVASGYFYLAMSCEQAGDISQAIRWYRKAIKCDPKFTSAYFALGTIYALYRNKEAEFYLRKAIEIDPNMAKAWYNLGLFYLENGNRKEALFCLQKAQKLGFAIPQYIIEMLEGNRKNQN